MSLFFAKSTPELLVACIKCDDRLVEFFCPWIWPISLVFVGWLFIGLWNWRRLTALTVDDVREPGRADPNALIIAAAAGAIVFVAHFTPWISRAGLAGAMVGCWFLYLVYITIRAHLRTQSPAATQLFRRINLIALVAAVVLGAFSWIDRRDTVAAVGLVTNTNYFSIGASHVLAHSDESLPVLRNRFSQLAKAPLDLQQQINTIPLLWCLGKLGDESDRQATRSLITQIVNQPFDGDGRWHLASLAIVARSDEPGTAEFLQKLADSNPDDQLRRIALCALLFSPIDEVRYGVAARADELIKQPFGSQVALHPAVDQILQELGESVQNNDKPTMETDVRFGSVEMRARVFNIPTVVAN